MLARRFDKALTLPGALASFACGIVIVALLSWAAASRSATTESGPASIGPTFNTACRPEARPAVPESASRAASRQSRPPAPVVDRMVLACQALGPAAPYPICGVDCVECPQCRCGCSQGEMCLPAEICSPAESCGSGTLRLGLGGLSSRLHGNAVCPSGGCRPGAHGPKPCGWEASRLINWQNYAQGEYCGPARTRHVQEYRLRVDDELDLVYRLTREEQPNPYQLNVGDEIQVESATDPDLDRNLLLQPDGTITLRLLGQVKATGRTIPQLREEVEELYKKYYKVPAITISPLRVNSKLDDLRNAVDSRFGRGGQNRAARVTPEGTISLPAIGVVQAQGLTLQELRVELREAYRKEVEGIEVIPVLVNRAPRYVYVLGEVALPGRYELSGPTTVLQALSMAGSWNVGAYLRQVVVLRRGEDWRLMATMLNLRPPLYGKQPCPPDEIWISDSDVVIVPKNPILVADEFIDLVFTRGIYGVFPMNTTLNFSKLSTL